MSKKEISGIEICIHAEIVDDEGYRRCIECKSKTILVYPIGPWTPDDEPFKAGEVITCEELDDIEIGEVTGHWCPTCEILTSLTYNFP
ncbi:hypothetical protein LCGC14_2235800 [marine sediment metagenome]|uniref:Uncharacterized protein n=1 Tax=marine sediment metagenome TaxID=412755 RepID=A0A0F9DUG8_9ZZZZ